MGAPDTDRALRAILDAIPEAIFIHREWRFLYANRAGAAAFGFDDPDAMRGADALSFVDLPDVSLVRERAELLAEGGSPETREIRFLRRDGSRVHLEMTVAIVEFEGGPAVASFARDLTARKVLESRVMRAERLMAVGTLASGVAHEISNPLSWILTNVDFVKRELASTGSPELHEALRDAREGLERVLGIVRDMRLLARSDADEKRAIDPRIALEAAISLLRPMIRQRARLLVTVRWMPAVLADDARLGQVFLTILRNAMQAVPFGDAEGQAVCVSGGVDDDGSALIEFADSGTGMSPTVARSVFDPFFTTREPNEGLGLGLSVAQAVVASYGGVITVTSEEGHGTSVRIVLPAAPADALGALAGPAYGPVRRARVLVVDDEPMVGTTVRRALREDHDVVACRSGLAALGRITSGERYDVMICDLVMPVMSGMELHRQVEQIEPELARRTVFVTGAIASAEVRAFLGTSANPRLEKPMGSEDLRAAVREALA